MLPTGCASVDALLQGGAREGQLLELFGDTAAGKSQLCLMAAAATAARGERVLYVDTSGAAAPARLAAMLRAMPRAGGASVAAALGRVEVVRAHEARGALAALDALLLRFPSADPVLPDAAAGGAPPAPAPPDDAPRLIVLASIGAIVAPVLGGGSGGHSQGHALLAALAGALKAAALHLNAAALVTNHMVGGGIGGFGDAERGGGGGSGGDRFASEKRPALGESWQGQAHVRLRLAAPAAEGSPYTAALHASTCAPPGAAAAFVLTDAGAEAPEQAASRRAAAVAAAAAAAAPPPGG
jgi:RAD51-like protein 3